MASLSNTLHYSAPDFSPSQLSNCTLNLKIAAWELIAVIFDEQNAVVALLQFPFSDQQPWQEQVINLLNTNNILSFKNWNAVNVVTCSKHFALIPDKIFNPDLLDQYQRLLFQPLVGERIAYTKHTNGYVNVFGLDAALEEWVDRFYNNTINYFHQTSGLIETVSNTVFADPVNLSVHIEPDYVVVIVKNGPALRFCNLYSTKADTDVAYFTLLVMKELGMKPETDTVTVFGNTDAEATTFKTLYRYIRNIKFGSKPTFLQFGADFDQVVAPYRHSDIYGVHLCGK